jgi:hypothetical protein
LAKLHQETGLTESEARKELADALEKLVSLGQIQRLDELIQLSKDRTLTEVEQAEMQRLLLTVKRITD